jgi:hypothetical protein
MCRLLSTRDHNPGRTILEEEIIFRNRAIPEDHTTLAEAVMAPAPITQAALIIRARRIRRAAPLSLTAPCRRRLTHRHRENTRLRRRAGPEATSALIITNRLQRQDPRKCKPTFVQVNGSARVHVKISITPKNV